MNDDRNGKPIDPALYPQLLTGGAIPALGVNVAATQVNFNNSAVLDAKTWHSFTPKAGQSYQVHRPLSSSSTMPKASMRADSTAALCPCAYNPKTVNTCEGGFKTVRFDHRLRINATGFYNDYSNLQTSVSAFSPISGTYVSARGNAPSAHTDGFQLETSTQPVRNLSLAFNATYLQTRYDDYSAPAYGAGPPTATSKRVLARTLLLQGAQDPPVPSSSRPGLNTELTLDPGFSGRG